MKLRAGVSFPFRRAGRPPPVVQGLPWEAAADPLADEAFRVWLDDLLAELRQPVVPIVAPGIDAATDAVVVERVRAFARAAGMAA